MTAPENLPVEEQLEELRQEVENLRMHFLLAADVIRRIGRHTADPEVREGLAALQSLIDTDRLSRSIEG